jgi:hypothetical protein
MPKPRSLELLRLRWRDVLEPHLGFSERHIGADRIVRGMSRVYNHVPG